MLVEKGKCAFDRVRSDFDIGIEDQMVVAVRVRKCQIVARTVADVAMSTQRNDFDLLAFSEYAIQVGVQIIPIVDQDHAKPLGSPAAADAHTRRHETPESTLEQRAVRSVRDHADRQPSSTLRVWSVCCHRFNGLSKLCIMPTFFAPLLHCGKRVYLLPSDPWFGTSQTMDQSWIGGWGVHNTLTSHAINAPRLKHVRPIYDDSQRLLRLHGAGAARRPCKRAC
ncbi:protein of unknown function [Pararobbsia alpina]